ncbi:unnamed protein product [Effrenium voratum]|nr:unnamed protein product [Effrenium voratum]CAJ1419484.1 unnamed protein product [Effrenium voratum]
MAEEARPRSVTLQEFLEDPELQAESPASPHPGLLRPGALGPLSPSSWGPEAPLPPSPPTPPNLDRSWEEQGVERTPDAPAAAREGSPRPRRQAPRSAMEAEESTLSPAQSDPCLGAGLSEAVARLAVELRLSARLAREGQQLEAQEAREAQEAQEVRDAARAASSQMPGA